ncbi:MAG: hypothetical protein JXP48_05265 [Acidobacteria bacterium]|nr:hypothetical protein [Acidobacteriota bacterium]
MNGSVWRHPLFRAMGAVILVAALYLGWTWYSRRSASLQLQERLQERSPEAQNQKIVDAYGGDELRILSFYGVPGVVRPGESAELCYGVSNASKVRMEPPVEHVWPSLGRCVQVAPGRDTEYTLVVEDAAGRSKTARLTIQVRAE